MSEFILIFGFHFGGLPDNWTGDFENEIEKLTCKDCGDFKMNLCSGVGGKDVVACMIEKIRSKEFQIITNL